MKVKKITLISVLASLLLVFSTLFCVSIKVDRAKAYVEGNSYANALVETSINTNYNVVRGSTYQLENGFTSSPKTLEALVRVGSIENWYYDKGAIIGGFSVGGKESFNLLVTKENKPRFWWRDGEVDYTFSNVILPQNEWVHLVVVRDTTNNLLKCYVNGSLAGSVESKVGTDLQVSATSPSPAHFIGRDARIYNFFSGSINYVGLSSKIMSETEVSSAYSNCQRLCKDTDSNTILAETCVPRTYYLAKSELANVPNTITTTINVNKKDTIGKNNSYLETPIVDAKDTTTVGYIVSNESYTGWGSTSYNTFELNIDTNGYVQITWDPLTKGATGGVADLTFDTAVSGYTGSLDVRTGTDVHIAVVRNKSAGTFSLYINGVHASNTVANDAVKIDMIPTLQLAIGKSRASNSKQLAFPGKINDVAFYSNALSSSQILSEYNVSNKKSITKTNYSGLIVNWVMEENQQALKYNKEATGVLKDYSGNGFDATLCSIADYFVPETQNWFEAGQDEYTLIYVPDTQCTVHSYSVLNDIMFDWIVENKDAMNLQFVMGLGDIVDGSPVTAGTAEADNPNYKILSEQWDSMASNYKKLTDAGIYWSSIVGNHDYDINNIRDLTERKAGAFNEHFGLSSSAVRGTNDTDFIKNSIVARYHTDTVATEAEDMLNVIYEYTATTKGGTQIKYLVVALEFGPSKAVLDWANEIVSQPKYASHRILFNTHSLVYLDGAFGDDTATGNPSDYWGKLTGSTVNETHCNPDFMWEYFMSKHPNMFIAGSGHIETDTNHFRQDQGIFGNTVTSFLCDGQGTNYFCSDGDDVSSWGDPLILVAKVNEKTKTISYRYFNPVNNCFLGVENQFEMDFSNWEAKSYNVTWKNYDETVLETDTDVVKNSAPEYNGTIPTKSGCTFLGWATSLNGTPAIQSKLPVVTENVIYYAIFASNDEICNITWVVDGKSTTHVVKKGIVPEYGEEVYKYGYEFIGWDKTIVVANGDATYTAKFSNISVWDGTYPNVIGYKFSGNGTKASPWLIQSAKDFAALSSLTYAQNYGTNSQYYKLTINLDLSAGNFQPICTDVEFSDNKWTTWYLFGANFDGDNHTITLNVNTNKFAYGLFGGLSGSVSNLTIEGTVNVTSNYVGALVSRVYNGATINNVTNKANVTGAGDQVGGLVGNANNEAVVTITNCSNKGNVSSTNGGFVAGILGGGWASIKLDNCSNSGNISGTKNVAGIIGELFLQGSIINCSNTGMVTASSVSATTKVGNYNDKFVGYIIGKDNVNTYYKITWVVDGVSTFDYFTSGETPVYNGTPTKANDAQFTYTFTGWDKDLAQVTQDATYTAVFSATAIQTSSSSSSSSVASSQKPISSSSQGEQNQPSSNNGVPATGSGCGADVSASYLFILLAIVAVGVVFIKKKN